MRPDMREHASNSHEAIKYIVPGILGTFVSFTCSATTGVARMFKPSWCADAMPTVNSLAAYRTADLVSVCLVSLYYRTISPSVWLASLRTVMRTVTVANFHLLVRLKVFNTEHMNHVVFAFRLYEDMSLSYSEIDNRYFTSNETHCQKIASVGRAKWICGTNHTGKDNVLWYPFDRSHLDQPQFLGRDQ